MLLLGDAALAQTIALVLTFFIAIGLIVTALMVYILGGVFGEHRENQERREGGL